MAVTAWKRLLAAGREFRGPGRFPIAAYSEFMPPPRLVRKPYGTEEPGPYDPDDPCGWQISEYEEALELRPGLEHLAAELLHAMEHLGHGRPAHGISQARLAGNRYWPPELAGWAGTLAHERYVVLSPLALSQTQDDKGRVRWTLFGGSEQGPGRAFWKGFWTDGGRELPAENAIGFFCHLLNAAYGESLHGAAELRRAGFRILPGIADPSLPYADNEPLPSWTADFLLPEGGRLTRVKYLLTFRPFGSLPQKVRRAYLAGDLHLLPFPGSLVFWGARPFLQLSRELPLALQVPLLDLFPRREAPYGLRVPQAGWMHEPHPAEKGDSPHLCAAPSGRFPQMGTVPFFGPDPSRGPYRNTFRRTHRWARVQRHEDELAVADGEDHVAHVLFSALPDDVGLYGKPMARNAQIWTHGFRLLLDGPRADRKSLRRAAAALEEGGQFGYRFVYPAMRVGRYEVYWHRPLVAFLSRKTGEPEVLADAPLGYLTAYRAQRPDPAKAIELWPRLLARGPHLAAVRAFACGAGCGAAAGTAAKRWSAASAGGTPAPQHHELRRTIFNARKILDAYDLRGGQPLERSFARALLDIPQEETLDDWLDRLETTAHDPEAGRQLAAELRRRIAPAPDKSNVKPRPVVAPRTATTGRGFTVGVPSDAPLTFHRTARRSFEIAYWRTIARLACGKYVNKDNADCVRDPVTSALLGHHRRDLEALGDYLLDYYRRLVERAGMGGRAAVGDLPFHWQTDFNFPWSGGWRDNQEGKTEERDLLVMIPGRDRRRAVIMADHYDTAYMEDVYEKHETGTEVAVGTDHHKGNTSSRQPPPSPFSPVGSGARLAAAGADDNHSATAALMLGAPVFMELSRRGQLGCDVWLVHLTGEEFPSDCMGARHLAQSIVEGSLKLRRSDQELPSHSGRGAGGEGHVGARRPLDLSGVQIDGVYVLDMVAHNNENDPDVFQISPGTTGQSLRLAEEAHLANLLWNAGTLGWNRSPSRRAAGRGKRIRDPRAAKKGTVPICAQHPEGGHQPKVGRGKWGLSPFSPPAIARHPQLHGEVRLPHNSRSSLYNTDGQIFSDAGIPVVLFMENYDINRHGYHDTQDTMANIDLDYGSALAAIAIETVARAAGK